MTRSATQYNAATLKAARTVLARQAAADAAAALAATTVKADAWKVAPASKGQTARINVIEVGLGYDASPRSILGTGQDARNLWRSLVNEATSKGYRVNRRTGELTVA